MKRGRYIVLTFTLLFLLLKADGQSLFQINQDSLAIFLRNRDYISLFTKIELLAKNVGSTKNKMELDVLGPYLKKDFGPLTNGEAKAIRVAASWVGYEYKNIFGDFRNALTYYLIAHRFVHDKELLDEMSWGVENVISTVYTRFGDYEKADYFSRLVEKSLKHLIRTENSPSQYIEKLSRYYANLGTQKRSELKDEEGLKCFLLGYNLADSINFFKGINPNALGLAAYYLDYSVFPQSEKYLLIVKNSLPYLRSENNYLARKAEFEYQTGKYYLKKGQNANNRNQILESLPHFKMALDTLSEFYLFGKRREFAKYYASFAQAYLELDSLKEADYYINQGLSNIITDYNSFEQPPQSNQLYAENGFIELFELQNLLYQKEYHRTRDRAYLFKALQAVDLGIKANNIIIDQIIADPSKLLSIRENKILTHEGLKVTYLLYSFGKESQYWEKARDLFNRSKSVLLDQKTRQHRLLMQISFEDSTSLVNCQWAIRDLHEEKFIRGINLDSLNGLILKYQEQMQILFNKYKDVQITSVERSDYMEYSILDDDIFVLSSIHGVKEFLKLGTKSELSKLLERLNDYIKLQGLSDDRQVLNELYLFLVKPVVTNFPQRIVIIPDGEIASIPFEILNDPEGRSLIDYCTISYAFQFESYKTTWKKTTHDYEIYCLVPTYTVAKKKEDMHTRGAIFQLPYAKAEADSILKLFGKHALISVDDTKGDIAKKLIQSKIFHFAGHAIVKKDNAFLVLGGDTIDQSQLTVDEIALLPQCADLVVLSACETGLGQYAIGEGIRSLGRSFIESGASATIISLWNVSDQSTSVIMAAFYKFLLLGFPKDEALRNAKQEYISEADRIHQHPYFWAAFIPSGDMGALEN